MNKETILKFLKSRKHAVIATSGDNNQPEAALIGFGETDDLEIIFGTYKTSRKYKNLKNNSKTAFVVGWEQDNITVQYEGVARELKLEEVDHYVSVYHTKVPSAAVFRNHPDQSYWIVTPTWIRYSDLSGDEEQVEEINF
jgi:pyridoxine/pyridoxamine 5'-phosphate oxidase